MTCVEENRCRSSSGWSLRSAGENQLRWLLREAAAYQALPATSPAWVMLLWLAVYR